VKAWTAFRSVFCAEALNAGNTGIERTISMKTILNDLLEKIIFA
jgi:hypothetical protein